MQPSTGEFYVLESPADGHRVLLRCVDQDTEYGRCYQVFDRLPSDATIEQAVAAPREASFLVFTPLEVGIERGWVTPAGVAQENLPVPAVSLRRGSKCYRRAGGSEVEISEAEAQSMDPFVLLTPQALVTYLERGERPKPIEPEPLRRRRMWSIGRRDPQQADSAAKAVIRHYLDYPDAGSTGAAYASALARGYEVHRPSATELVIVVRPAVSPDVISEVISDFAIETGGDYDGRESGG